MLGRLQPDHIDLLYLHRVDPEMPIEDVPIEDVPIPGATKIHHERDNLGALGLQLSADDLAAFRREPDSLPVAATPGQCRAGGSVGSCFDACGRDRRQSCYPEDIIGLAGLAATVYRSMRMSRNSDKNRACRHAWMRKAVH